MGGFDHAAVHVKSATLYVAHTANDAVDLIDCHREKYLRSISGLPGVAGVLVSNEKDLVFTSNRGEKTVGIFPHDHEKKLEKVRVGGFPNGLAFDSSRDHLLSANVSRPDNPAPITVSIVDVKKKILISDIAVPGRTRWAVFDSNTDLFYVNISTPSQIIAVSSEDPDGIISSYAIPATGPHGLDIDLDGRRLFCACDQGGLYTVDLASGKVSHASELSGTPDVIFYNHVLGHLYVTIGDPGVIEVFDSRAVKRIQTVKTELGTHTMGFNPETHMLYGLMPESHSASIFEDK
jgi:DNA-binding beta-propeller fold protein YncE